MSRALVMRELGQFPISIASSLALEGFFGIHPDLIGEKDYSKDFKEIWINVRTLVRNIDGALPKETKIYPKDADYYNCLISEMQIIVNHLKTKLGDDLRVVFYAMSYQRFTQFWSHAIFKDKSTDIQLRYAGVENRCLSILDKDVKSDAHGSLDIRFFDTHIGGIGEDAVVLSHFPVDLLLTITGKFKALLESHTGRVKLSPEWNTKLKNGRDYPRIPFDRCMIQIFGDSSGMVKPQDIKVRRKMLEIAEKHQWDAQTTRARVKLCVGLAKEPVLMDLVNRLY